MPHCPARRPLDGSPCSLLAGESHPDGLHVTYSDQEARRGILAMWSDPHPFESLPADEDESTPPMAETTTPTRPYTVIGLRDAYGTLTVAGVVEGIHDMADTEPGDADHGTQRWAGHFDATDPDDAERQAHDETTGGDEG